MKHFNFLLLVLFIPLTIISQDLTEGLLVNDLELHPMQEMAKPAYLETITDPSFGTTIRRITNAQPGQVIVPMYSTIQAWNADESRMIIYNQSIGDHQLLDGETYEYIRDLDDFSPLDLEQIFWDFQAPDILYYPESGTRDFIRYNVETQSKEVLMNMEEISGCTGFISMGNDVQMMSWDSDVFSFRCENSTAYNYRISTGELTEFNFNGGVSYVAPMPGPSGDNFYHSQDVYDADGNYSMMLNQSSGEHACLGQMSNGNDALYAVSFAQGPQGGCLANLAAHDLVTGSCTPLISQDQGYDYPKSGTHISALAHKNTDGAWVAASMIGFEEDGVALLDQELVVAKVENGEVTVCRIGHHRSDENEFNYWGEPHAVISPKGTRVLFGSDWSGAEDGESVDCYVVELPSYSVSTITNVRPFLPFFPAFSVVPISDSEILVKSDNPRDYIGQMEIFNAQGALVATLNLNNERMRYEVPMANGIYVYRQIFEGEVLSTGKFKN